MNLFQEKNIKPMLLEEQKEPFNSDKHYFEIKYDGIRALIYVSPKEFVIKSRNNKDITRKFPELKEIQKLVNFPTIFDGELAIFKNNIPDFSEILKRSHLTKEREILLQSKENPVIFICFDILYQQKELINKPLFFRKELLNKIPDTDVFIKSIYIETQGLSLFNKIKELHLEGIVAKEKDSLYVPNTRSLSWIKIKNLQTEVFYIGGYSEKESTPFFSAYLGEFQNKDFLFVGKVSIPKKEKIYEKLKKEHKKQSPFTNFHEENIHYCTPKIACFIEYLERSRKNHLRHPVYRGAKKE